MIILPVKLQFTGNYIHLAFVLQKAILEESLAEHLPSLSCIGFAFLKKKKISFLITEYMSYEVENYRPLSWMCFQTLIH